METSFDVLEGNQYAFDFCSCLLELKQFIIEIYYNFREHHCNDIAL